MKKIKLREAEITGQATQLVGCIVKTGIGVSDSEPYRVSPCPTVSLYDRLHLTPVEEKCLLVLADHDFNVIQSMQWHFSSTLRVNNLPHGLTPRFVVVNSQFLEVSKWSLHGYLCRC